MPDEAKRTMLVACLACGAWAHVPEGAQSAAWHLSHACDDGPQPDANADQEPVQ